MSTASTGPDAPAATIDRGAPAFSMPLTPRWRWRDKTFSPTPIKAAITTVVLLWLVSIPQSFSNTELNRFSEIMCLAVAAAGLNLLTGFNGQISVGHGAFYALGAYTSLLLMAEWEWHYVPAVAASVVLCFLAGLVVGLPALRIKGLYLAIATLALATLTPQIIIRFSDLTGGSQGRRISRAATPEVFGFNQPPEWAEGFAGATSQWHFYVTLAAVLVVYVIIRNLVRSRVGRALVATRDNEVAAEVVGVPLARYKVMTFGVSAMLAGLGGSLEIFRTSGVAAGRFTIQLSIVLLVSVVVGGAATLIGPFIGAFLVVMIPHWLPRDLPEASLVLFGLSLILLMRVAPGGIVGLLRKTWLRISLRINPPPGMAPPPQPPSDGAQAARDPVPA